MRALSIAAAAAALSLVVATNAAAQSPAPTPHARELARQIFEASGGETNVHAIVDAIQGSVGAAQLKMLPPERRAAAGEMQAAVHDELMQTLLPKIIDYSVDLYATNFSEQELADIATFYASPTGKALVAKTPLIARAMGPFLARELPLMMTDVVDRYCAKTECTPQARAALMAAMPGAARPAAP